MFVITEVAIVYCAVRSGPVNKMDKVSTLEVQILLQIVITCD